MTIPSQRVLIGVCGGIAAYKVCEVVSQLFQRGVEIRVILTNAAREFIQPLTFSTLSRHRAYTDADFWQPIYSRPLHIELGEWADLIVIAPLTANTLAKLAYGMADNLLTNTVLASPSPVLVAPAMNTDMWEQPTVQDNWQKLLRYNRYHAIDTASGLLACDRVGAGRMAEPGEIISYVESLLHTHGKRDYQGQRVLISAGGTREFLDPVRYIGNPSTGKMGLALAQAAQHRGASVTLISSSHLNFPLGVRGISVVSAEEMHSVMLRELPNQNVIIMSAAVADVKPRDFSPQKLPKHALGENLSLTSVPDIVADLAKHKQPQQILVGFAAQTGDILTPAREKLQKKQLDAIIANPIDQPDSGFQSDTNQAIFLDRQEFIQEIPQCSKLKMAHIIYDLLGKRFHRHSDRLP
ncbi:bifunctional phosphopantothenoylcysteine decarboxylase/phosphopantothenate--cysteine ligase CoaBC [Calothrix sp. NIES-3974]|uniref:bifunctional phosphopantothenoylcysteine decarboxylase/phosphopantothenate--cysteine ligase CoaBC n=1 Tax=Calothrix sp. NIES-3974 TaxID=2005462 RepID=UPI000B606333|nr:bifunctional phosphopantothenoylcysteine decarboxylase/phosphopantothenate--cysteine ligase CoaBC [Calothrix sp. NIES-3974]BAZ05372.1 phosphopantothenoylcysteine decarboxylase/phosphopantothenate--cysteine ligase [Calothrix sp. NIES-3974]